jgi:enamine deaminase RidA (YjgF/YER057c/UK114 family)
MGVEERLKELGIVLPEVPKPVAAYVPAVVSGNHVFTSGQIPMVKGKLKYAGKVDRDLSVEEASEAARICALNALAAVRSVLGSLDRVVRIVKVTGYVACVEAFADQPKVMNGASNLLVEIFGEAGRHARSAVGTNALPLNAAVEIEILAEVKD